ncbi:uncharacterized protein LOC103575638 isoform X1 [Microplitis demolitor]|uniref:uncharacterized protein LOC103575638 isoform X1 n=1 Tax=Microplitis demolitor TaxID=69319 RepID=UPI0004CD1372|nr:uncharacterized protein LOC103575638 isoform X1 [Microplitis demolitor]
MECPGPVESGRNFRLLSEEELPQLLEFLNGYLPESLKFHQTVLTYINNKVWDFYFYVANDWPEVPVCLHFPGMTLSPHGLLYESFGVYCPTDKLDNLTLLREEDILIDWTKPLYINFIHCDIADELFRLYNDIGTIERVLGDVWAYKKFDNENNDDESTSLMDELDEKYDNQQEIKQSDEQEQDVVEVLPLNSEHAEGIHELYPANDMECHELFLRLIRILPAGGVFVNNILAAWMIQSYYGAMFSMQTKPEYRRKGYGTRLARFLTKVVSDRGYIPFVVIRPENEASQSLYKKLGFHRLYQTVRATMIPHGWEEETVGIVEELDQVQKTDSDCEKFDILRKLRIEERVIDAFTSENDEQTVVPTVGQDDDDNTILDTSESPKDDDDNELEGENGYGKCHDEVLEPIDENVEDKITDDCDSG